MPDEPEILTVAELNVMRPDERAAAFEQRLVTEFGSLPEEFGQQVVATASQLGQERRSSTSE